MGKDLEFLPHDGDDDTQRVTLDRGLPVHVVAGSTAGTEYTEGDTDASITGPALMWEADTGTNTLRPVNATYPLPVDVKSLPALAAGNNNIGDVDVATLPSNTVAGASSLPTGSNTIGNVGVVGTATVAGTVAVSSLPALPAGTNNIGDVDVLSLPSTTVAGATAKTADYDTRLGSTDTVPIFGLAVPKSGGAVAGGTLTDPIRVDPTGATPQPVWMALELPAGEQIIGRVVVERYTAGAITEVQGDVPHGGGYIAQPVPLGLYVETPEDTVPSNRVTAEGKVARLAGDADGALYVRPHGPQMWNVSAEQTAQQTDTTVHAAPGVGLSLYVTDIFVACNGAVTVTFEEGTATFKWRYYASAAGDGASVHFLTPLKILANTALTVTSSAGVTITYVVSGYISR